MSVQIIERNGQPEWAILPYDDYLELVGQAELLQDIRDYDSVMEALEKGEEELIPSDVVYALLDGANPIAVWRKHRGLSQHELAEAASISVPYVSQIESGKRKGSTEILARIASALRVTLDDIVVS